MCGGLGCKNIRERCGSVCVCNSNPYSSGFYDNFMVPRITVCCIVHSVNQYILLIYWYPERLRWSRGSVLAFSTQVRGFKPGRSRRIFKGEKVLSTPSFGGEVKPSVPCRRFAPCKRSLNGVEVVISAKLPDNILAPQFPLPPLGSLTSWWTWRHLVVKSGDI